MRSQIFYSSSTKRVALILLSFVLCTGCSVIEEFRKRGEEDFNQVHIRYPIKFNSQRWKAARNEQDGNHLADRQKMYSDLLREHPLVGMNKNEIVSLLGPFDQNEGNMNEDECGYLVNDRDPYGELFLIIKFKKNKAVSQELRGYNP